VDLVAHEPEPYRSSERSILPRCIAITINKEKYRALLNKPNLALLVLVCVVGISCGIKAHFRVGGDEFKKYQWIWGLFPYPTSTQTLEDVSIAKIPPLHHFVAHNATTRSEVCILVSKSNPLS